MLVEGRVICSAKRLSEMLLLSVRQSKALWEGCHFYFAGRLSCFRQSYFLFKYVDWSSHFVFLRTFPAIQCKIPTQKLQFFTLAISIFYIHLNRFFTFFSTFFFIIISSVFTPQLLKHSISGKSKKKRQGQGLKHLLGF
jgi:hypothetical protein